MFLRSERRAGAALAIAIGLVFFSAKPAHADAAAETYVSVNAGQAMNTLGATGSQTERSAKFGALMDKFTDVPALSDFVLGVYARGLRADASLKAEWVQTFREYAIATYEDQLDKYRGSAIKVLGSRDSTRNSKVCSVVGTEMIQPKTGQPLRVNWYLCKPAAGGDWKVADVGLVLGDSEMKMAITQRDQFVAFLGGNGGDVRKLIARVKTQTVAMRTRTGAKKT